ncbi:hypothetical protein HELRODRAFT_172687 [Helobdella robusta]|uniref:Uncharacterized protein n=1 Tax=Helobdella robusta TaxID=6412 RepID=T1F5S4_HELRO|nr:hypothetical protein HELRODRAFT_172687 [Helobdella robusta]ESO04325.1 hypothetical protein HELRODRAFT_172687 [Helobdella robusta]
MSSINTNNLKIENVQNLEDELLDDSLFETNVNYFENRRNMDIYRGKRFKKAKRMLEQREERKKLVAEAIEKQKYDQGEYIYKINNSGKDRFSMDSLYGVDKEGNKIVVTNECEKANVLADFFTTVY